MFDKHYPPIYRFFSIPEIPSGHKKNTENGCYLAKSEFWSIFFMLVRFLSPPAHVCFIVFDIYDSTLFYCEQKSNCHRKTELKSINLLSLFTEFR